MNTLQARLLIATLAIGIGRAAAAQSAPGIVALSIEPSTFVAGQFSTAMLTLTNVGGIQTITFGQRNRDSTDFTVVCSYGLGPAGLSSSTVYLDRFPNYNNLFPGSPVATGYVAPTVNMSVSEITFRDNNGFAYSAFRFVEPSSASDTLSSGDSLSVLIHFTPSQPGPASCAVLYVPSSFSPPGAEANARIAISGSGAAFGPVGPTGPAGPTGANGNDGASSTVTISSSQFGVGGVDSYGNNNCNGGSGTTYSFFVNGGLATASTICNGAAGASGATPGVSSFTANTTDPCTGQGVLCNGSTGAYFTINGSPICPTSAICDGATGQAGPAGSAGQTGATGLNGATGATGLSGATGATGLVGATGVTGANGVSASVSASPFGIHSGDPAMERAGSPTHSRSAAWSSPRATSVMERQARLERLEPLEPPERWELRARLARWVRRARWVQPARRAPKGQWAPPAQHRQ